MDLGNRQFIGGGKVYKALASDKTFSGWGKSYMQSLEDERIRKAQEFAQMELNTKIQAGEVNPDGTEKKGPSNIFEHLASFGTDMAAAAQVGVAGVADTALMARAGLVSGINDINPFSSEESKEDIRETIYNKTEKARDEIKAGKTIRGTSLNDREDFQFTGDFGRDAADLAGRSVQVGLDATMFANPARLATKQLFAQGAKEGIKATAKVAGRDAAFFGAADATATGLSTYGETGDVGEALAKGAQAGALTAVTSGTLDIAGSAMGAAGRNAFEKAQAKSTDTTKVATKLISELPEEVVAQPGIVDRISQISESSKNVGEFKTNFEAFRKELETPAETTATRADAPTEAAPTVAPESRQLGSGVRSIDENDADLQRLQAGEDDTVMRTIGNDGTDITSTAANFDNQINQLDAEVTRLNQARQQLQRQADGINENTGTADAPEGVDPSTYDGDVMGRTKAEQGVQQIDAQIAELTTQKQTVLDESQRAFERVGGAQRSVDPELARARMKELRAERAQIQEYSARKDSNKDSAAIKRDIEDIDRGVVPEQFLKNNEPVATVDQAIVRAMKGDPTDSLGLQEAFTINQDLRVDAAERLQRLTTPEQYKSYMQQLDDNYRISMEEIKEMPEPRQEQARMELNEDYTGQMLDQQERVQSHAPEVQRLQEAITMADEIDARIVDEWNSMEQSNPQAFADVDQDMLDTYRESLVKVQAQKALEEGNALQPLEKMDAVSAATQGETTKAGVKKVLDSEDAVGNAADEVMADALTSGKTDVTLVDTMLREPRKWMMRWGTAGKEIAGIAETAVAGMNKFNGDLQARFRQYGWAQTFKKKYNDQTVDFLNEGKELTKANGETQRHFDRRVAASNDIKSWFREVGRKLDLPEDVVMRDYLPHIFEKEYGLNMEKAAESLALLRSGKTVNGRKLSDAQKAKLQKSLEPIDAQTREMIEARRLYIVKNGHLEKRTGAEGWTRDLELILSEYARSAAKEIHMKPALEKIQKRQPFLEKQQNKLLDQWVAQWSGKTVEGSTDARMVKTNIPGTPFNLRQALSGSRRLQNVALMGASVRTVVLQTGGIVNIFAESGSFPQFVKSGLNAAMSKGPQSKLRLEAFSEGVMEGSFSGLLTGGRGVAAFANKTEKKLYSGIAFVDEHMRVWAYDMGKNDYAKSIGKSLSDLTPDELVQAKAAGVQKAKDTQFNMDALSIPTGQNTEVGKMITQIQQFNLKQTEFNAKLFFGDSPKSAMYKTVDGKIQFSKEGATRLAKALVGYGVLVGTMTSAAEYVFGEDFEEKANFLGLDWEDFVPFGEQVVSGIEVLSGKEGAEFAGLSTPLLSFIFGSSRGDGAIDFASAAVKYANGEIDQEEWDAVQAKAPGFFTRNLLPGGTQLVRSIEGGATIGEGESKNAQGNTRFLIQNKGIWNQMKALIGGQYATDEGQEWLRNGMNTINKKHKVDMPDGSKIPVSEYARSLGTEEQAKWVSYYQGKQAAEKQLSSMGRSKTTEMDRLKAQMQSGRMTPAQAQIEANKWNADVINLFKPYMAEQMPPRLTDDLLNHTLITIEDSQAQARKMSTARRNELSGYAAYEGYDEEEY